MHHSRRSASSVSTPSSQLRWLQPDQHLGNHDRRKPPQADLPAPPDRCLSQPPPLLVEVPILAAGATESELMGLAVEPAAMTSLLHTGNNRARIAPSKRLGRRMPAELGHADPERVGLVEVCSTQPST